VRIALGPAAPLPAHRSQSGWVVCNVAALTAPHGSDLWPDRSAHAVLMMSLQCRGQAEYNMHLFVVGPLML